MYPNHLSNLTRTGIKAAYRIAGLDKKQSFFDWLGETSCFFLAPDMYYLLRDVIGSKYGPFEELPELEQHAIMVAIDVVEFAFCLVSDDCVGEVWKLQDSDFECDVSAVADKVGLEVALEATSVEA